MLWLVCPVMVPYCHVKTSWLYRLSWTWSWGSAPRKITHLTRKPELKFSSYWERYILLLLRVQMSLQLLAGSVISWVTPGKLLVTLSVSPPLYSGNSCTMCVCGQEAQCVGQEIRAESSLWLVRLKQPSLSGVESSEAASNALHWLRQITPSPN